MVNYLSLAVNGYIRSYSGLSKLCWMGIAFTLINAISQGVSFFLSLYFVNTLHFNVAYAGFILSSYGLGTVMGGSLGGRLSDKFFSGTVSLWALFFQAIAYFLLAKLTSFEWLLVIMYVLGVSTYIFKTSNNLWMLSQSGEGNSKLKILSTAHVASNLGLGISGILMGFIAGYGFENIFILASMVLIILISYMLLKLKEMKPCTERVSKIINPQTKTSFSKADKKILYMILSCVFFIGLIIAQLGTTYPVYVQSVFPLLGVKAVSILFLLDTALIVLFQAPLINFLGGENKILIVGIGAALMGAGMLILSFSYSYFAVGILSCIVWTTGEMLFVSTAQAVCYEKGGENKQGHSVGLFQSIFATSLVVGPTFGGFVYHYFGGNMVWYLSGTIGLLCFLVCLFHARYD